jgi:nucleoside-triphosphatase THEP1
MLGYVISDGRGTVDPLMAEVAGHLMAQGWPVAGVIQVNVETGPETKCDMDLQVLAGTEAVRISQRLGPMARGCRLDPAGLERAVGLVERALDAGPRLVLINKFGKAELEGRGFRPLIGRALSEGVPVLTAVNRANLPGFQAFTDGIGTALPAEPQAILDWCAAQVTQEV